MPVTADDRLFQILSAEQQHIDRQVESMINFQAKILAVLFPALGVAAGWILTAPGQDHQSISPPSQVAVLLIIDGLMCFTALLSVIYYSWSAEYSRYKKDVVGPRLASLLSPGQGNPLDSASFGTSREGRALGFGLASFWIVITAAMTGDLTYAIKLVESIKQSMHPPAYPLFLGAAWLACCLLSVMTIAAAGLSAGAILKRGIGRAASGNSSGTSSEAPVSPLT